MHSSATVSVSGKGTASRRWFSFHTAALLALVVAATLAFAPTNARAQTGGSGADNSRVIGTVTIDGIATAGIPIRSFRVGLQVLIDPTGAARLRFSDMTVVKDLDSHSPALLVTATSRKGIRTVTIDIFHPGTTTLLARYKLSNVLISVQTHSDQGRANGFPIEELSFNYGRIELTVGSSTAGWDLEHDRPL